MTDLERELRDLLRDDAHAVPTPTTAPPRLRRAARWRQVGFATLVGGTTLAVLALVIGISSLVLPLGRDGTPAVEPTTIATLNGITISYPQRWILVDPDDAGLNGPGPSTELPRIVLALAPTDPRDAFGCPGLASGAAPTFLMTVQEMPLAVSGDEAAPWPASLEPLAVDASESACYPGWEFLTAVWTAEERSFDARIGLAHEVRDEDREALLAAFGSMRFAPTGEGARAVVLATGTAGGEGWQLIADRGDDGMSLSIEGDRFGAGIGGFERMPDELEVTSHAIGDDQEVIVVGAAPSNVVRVEAFSADGGAAVSADVIDVPDAIDPELGAFVLVVRPGASGRIDLEGDDAAGHTVIRGSVGPEDRPVGTPLPTVLRDGRHFGFIRSVDVSGRSIALDLASFLTGEEAQAAWEAAGGTGPLPNDNWVVNDDPRVHTLPLALDLQLRLLDWNRCCDTFFDGDLALFAQAIASQSDVTDGDLIYRGKSQWWITVEDGVVTRIEEQYAP